MYNGDIIAERIRKQAKVRGVPLKSIFEEIGLGRNFIASSLTAGSMPKADNLARIADYFDISVDYLLGRSDDDTPMSFVSSYAKAFCNRLGELMPTFDFADMEAAGIDEDELWAIARMKKKLTLDKACSIADALGVSMDDFITHPSH